MIDEKLELKMELQGSFLKFIKYFYELRNGRPFVISRPPGRESHHITISRELTSFVDMKTQRLMINIAPGLHKSTMLVYWVAWTYTNFYDLQYLYISFSKSLAEKHTGEIKSIMSMTQYTSLFDVSLAQDSTAKGKFRTIGGGSVSAFGSRGSITGQDAGLPNMDRFSGCVIIDDAHKPDEVHSDVMRQAVIDNYNQTIKPRPRGENVGIIFIGQRLHEDDLPAFLERGEDGYQWRILKLKAIDDSGNPLAPAILSKERLLIEKDTNPYVYSSQYQQEPVPAGGGIFKEEWFNKLDIMPTMLKTFITVDTAETEKEYNDATVFSFWGIYRPIIHGREIDDLYALHWIDCWEMRVEPKDLVNSFMDFWAQCMQFPEKPLLAAIEKKSTGSTLISMLKNTPGIRVHEIPRSRASGSKTDRFLKAQKFIAEKLVTLPSGKSHTEICIEHMSKITANNTHRFDDIADTCADAIQLGLSDKLIISQISRSTLNRDTSKLVMSNFNKINELRAQSYYSDF